MGECNDISFNNIALKKVKKKCECSVLNVGSHNFKKEVVFKTLKNIRRSIEEQNFITYE